MISLINHDFQGSVAVRSLEFTQILWNISMFETTNQKTWPFFHHVSAFGQWSRYISPVDIAIIWGFEEMGVPS